MDERDLEINKLLNGLSDERVPFGFEEIVTRKIEAEIKKRRERRETISQIIIAAFMAVLFISILLFLNYRFFKIDIHSFKIDAPSFNKDLFSATKSVFAHDYTIRWVLIGANAAILLIIERIVSWKYKERS